ncbi:hypothetical protein BpHYR1_005919 [Brachionus plicatilis]|uniref:Uncharacterized protein n=1 Tax=Brachionus plicatilis TaxID=10195 RepID=A0A3M7QJ03_BRAPC|nr:hypothetical protein BpHYR1_005919 [Brachionus plicatilis]
MYFQNWKLFITYEKLLFNLPLCPKKTFTILFYVANKAIIEFSRQDKIKKTEKKLKLIFKLLKLLYNGN